MGQSVEREESLMEVESHGAEYARRVREIQAEAGYDSTGSHYTPSEMVVPMVEASLRPLLEEMGEGASVGDLLSLKVCDPAMGAGAFLVEVCRQLADAVLAARVRDGEASGDDRVSRQRAMRDVADRCVHGVDINPVAVNMARVVVWLLTDVPGERRARLRLRLRHGDGLLGLSVEQILDWTWEPRDAMSKQAPAAFRRRLRDRGDAVVAAFFAGSNLKERLGLLAQYRTDMLVRGSDALAAERLDEALSSFRARFTPLHWPLTFVDVFHRERPGFDAFVGNPPFVGGQIITRSIGPEYRDWLLASFEGSTGRVDLSTYFFRRAFELLRPGGTLGFITTHAVSLGDNRPAGLGWIRAHGGTIYRAYANVEWPNRAAVWVSNIHAIKGERDGPYDLNGREVDQITAFLMHLGGDADPVSLSENAGRARTGLTPGNPALIFEDSENSRKRGSHAVRHVAELIAKDPRNANVIEPLMGGVDMNQSPAHLPTRYLINFDGLTLEEAQSYEDVWALFEEGVERSGNDDWRPKSSSNFLAKYRRHKDRAICCGVVSSHLCFGFVPTRVVGTGSIALFRLSSDQAMAIMQSRAYAVWANKFSSKRSTSIHYLVGPAFETFPFPRGWRESERLQAIGRAYDEHRSALMLVHGEGLTTTYNRFHHPEMLHVDGSPPQFPEGVERLRELQREMDRAVLSEYGWDDLDLTYDFRVDPTAPADQRSATVLYRWSDDVEAEVIGRLMERNAARAAEDERRFGS